ncbi:hypothetical protein CEXT_433311, partial [Caerostris extrusa]
EVPFCVALCVLQEEAAPQPSLPPDSTTEKLGNFLVLNLETPFRSSGPYTDAGRTITVG